MQWTPPRPSRAWCSRFQKISLLSSNQMGKKPLMAFERGSKWGQQAWCIIKLTVKVPRLRSMQIWLLAFFSATDIWLTWSMGSSTGTMIPTPTGSWSSVLTTSFLDSGRVRAAQWITEEEPPMVVKWTFFPGKVLGVSLNASENCENYWIII